MSPRNGATVGQNVRVQFGSAGITIQPAGSLVPNSGHHHLLIDVADLPPRNTPIPSDAMHKHYGKGQTQDTIKLKPGTHTLQLELGNAMHMPFDPRVVSEKITIHVK